MASIIIKDIPPYDGEYEVDVDQPFNAREWRVMKKVSGYMPMTIDEGFAGQDPDVFIALSVIAMCRAGKIQREDQLEVADILSEVPYSKAVITFVGDKDDEEPDEVPLDLTPTPDEPSRSDLLSSVG